ncbi:DUF4286 family protein [Rhodocaloribacter sp.]
MLIYEVNLHVKGEAADAFSEWLRGHIREMLAIDGFERAVWLRAETDRPGTLTWCVHYYVTDRAHLNAYFERHADAMREDGLRRFGGKFTADRRILDEVEAFEKRSGKTDQRLA